MTTLIGGKLPLTGGTITGNVGIGTSSPANKLHVKELTAHIDGIVVDGYGGSWTAGTGKLLHTRATSPTSTYYHIYCDSDYDDSGKEVFSVRGDGIVQLGATNAAGLNSSSLALTNELRVNGGTDGGVMSLATAYKSYQMGAGDPVGALYFTDATSGVWAGIKASANSQGGGSVGSPLNSNDYPGRLEFLTTPNGSGSPTERMRIDSAGNVGIGTTTPSTKLDVAGEIKLSTTGISASAAGAGAIRYATGKLEVSDGTGWSLVSKEDFSATGGTITTSGGYKIHTFTTSGTFTPSTNGSIDYVIIGGGGGSGSSGGGGGAGGYRYYTNQNITGGSYSVVIGAGGAGGPVNAMSGVASNGGNSSFNSITSLGGGGGGNWGQAGASGGSGGGAGRDDTRYTGSGAGTSGQGYAGGNTGSGSGSSGGGGGGGATAVGSAGVTDGTGNGGAGSNALSAWATATSTGDSGYYAGGGGGGGYYANTNGSGGAGGGGNGGIDSARAGQNGQANTGGGAGGSGGGGGGADAGSTGGSGIVIIRYAV
jgi:hypothetical protein